MDQLLAFGGGLLFGLLTTGVVLVVGYLGVRFLAKIMERGARR